MMSLFPRLFRSLESPWEATNDRWYNVISPTTGAGIKVSEESALKYLTVFSCVSLVAGDIARLPLIVYKRKQDGSKERVIDHPLYDILHNSPNPNQNSFSWRESSQGHLMLWGNTYGEIIRKPYSGEVLALMPIENPGGVTIKKTKRGIFYEWHDDATRIVKPKRDMLHIPGFGFNGLTGLSMISLAREAIGLGLATETFGSKFFSEGTHPAGLVSMHPDAAGMSDKQIKEYQKYLKENYAGLGKSHGLMLLPNGETYTPLTIPLNDAQFLESRSFQKEEICGMYHVPPHKIAKHGQNSNYNNLEQENQNYLDACLTHWTSRWEQCINHQLLTPEERRSGLFVEFLLAGFLKGDTKARSEFYKTLFNMGYPLNRILSKENENPVKGGDQGFIQLNMVPVEQASALAKASVKAAEAPKKEPKEKKTLRNEKRSIIIRDRISDQYRPLIHRAAEEIVSYESKSIKDHLEKRSLESWLDGFYRDLPEYIKEKIGPVFRSFATAIRDAAAEEIGIEPDEVDIEKFVSDYIETYALRHSSSSHNQLLALLEDEIDGRVSEWEEKRADKIADNEITRASNAVFQFVAFGAGLSTVWRIRGAHTCPYCKTLSGKRVRRNQVFVKKGEEIAPEGETPMKNRGIKRHPPLHRGCDCYLGII